MDRVSDSTLSETTPGIVEMTETAIRFLQKKSENGFFLLVEGGRIDHAHHRNSALLALEEAVALHQAVAIAKKLTNDKDTLILVTADHSHTFNINGYPMRGNKITGKSAITNENHNTLSQVSFIKYNIFRPPGLSENKEESGKQAYNYTTLSYSTGPGFWSNVNNQSTDPHHPWLDPSTLNIHDKSYRQSSQIPSDDAYHGGEDVAVYATGIFFFSNI